MIPTPSPIAKMIAPSAMKADFATRLDLRAECGSRIFLRVQRQRCQQNRREGRARPYDELFSGFGMTSM